MSGYNRLGKSPCLCSELIALRQLHSPPPRVPPSLDPRYHYPHSQPRPDHGSRSSPPQYIPSLDITSLLVTHVCALSTNTNHRGVQAQPGTTTILQAWTHDDQAARPLQGILYRATSSTIDMARSPALSKSQWGQGRGPAHQATDCNYNPA